MQTQKALEYFEKNYINFLEDLKSLVRIPSISASGFDHKNVASSAEAVSALMKESGLGNVEILAVNGGHPYTYGEWLGKKGAKTVLMYAHHDVQPTGDISKWQTKPFEPELKGDRLYGRGAADDKAGVVSTIASVASYLKSSGELPLNVKIIIEGEEEIGSENLPHLLNQYKEKLMADYIILSDTGNYDIGIPAVTTQLRGIVAIDITVSALKQPMHSGMWGGPLPDPVQALAKIIARLTDDRGKILIPGVYDDVTELSTVEKKKIQDLPWNEKLFREQACVLEDVELEHDTEHSPNEQIWFRPSLSVNAIQASSREQVSNIIVDSAWAHVGIRIVPNMDMNKVLTSLTNFLHDSAPKGLIVEIKPHTSVSWWKTDTKHAAFKAAKMAIEKGYGREPVFIGSGGSIGFVEPFTRALNDAPAILVGVEDPQTNAHSWNESLYLPDWRKCIISTIHLFAELARIKK
ncbi:MAG: M20/M25/M40 family metallo-hydrolase [Candidatus Vogelbacteria bacterium]|nr:M20/M25/M40 family metallo-hydrolase [Candidatus Vogelbacteria bacterium]